MERFRRWFAYFLPLLLLTVLAGQADATLKAVGPVDPVTTLPTWYQDTNNLALMLCTDQNGFCLLGPPFDPAGVPPISPITTTGPINDTNFPDESFYYSAQSIMPIEGGELANLAFVMEAAFLSGVVPDGGITFLRTDLQKMRNLTPNSTYRVTHPYGTFLFDTDAAGDTTGGGGVAIRLEDGPGVPAQWMPTAMKNGTNTGIGPFLTRAVGGLIVDPVSGHTYIGDGATEVEIVGSPTGNNFYRIERIVTGGPPVSVQSAWQKNTFVLNGRVFTGAISSDLSVSATYARDASSAQVDVFATALPGAVLTLSGTGITQTPLTPDTPANGTYFLTIPLATSTLPTNLLMTNSLDLQNTPPHPVTLVDEVIISEALYNPVARTIMIKAHSRDELSPPTLTATDFAAPNTLSPSGTLIKTLAANDIPPQHVTVVSSYSGKATIAVSVVNPPPPPVATADTATTSRNTAVVINVLANDTTDASLDPATVVTANPVNGTAVANASGSVTFTPTAGFTGTASFTYTVKDTFNQTSNSATVTVTVHAPPVAVNDAASAVIGTTVNIDVIANDSAFSSSINSTTVNIVSPASCGSTGILANGTVNFTAPASIPAGPGTCSFSYVVSDTFVPAALSNVATVTVTITPPPAPVAVNDAATTVTGSPVIINVIANDTSAVSTINPATVAVYAPTSGTAAANLNGTVTYNPPAAAGTYTFAYTVKDNAVPSLISNTALVTVTVTVPTFPPVAVNDTAATTVGSPVAINVLANDTITPPSTINPATVVVGVPTGGTAVANAITGVVTYTPPAAAGTYTFTYTVKNNAVPAETSNSATVTVTVAAAVVPPVANNDTATTSVGSPIDINVLANDTIAAPLAIDPTSVAVSVPTGGTAVANAVTGVVTYTPPAAAGTYTFTYTVNNNAVPPATSNSATVTVTVAAANIPPVANNDTATAATSATITINVLANDTSATSIINPATVVVTPPAPGGGTAVANANGTVSYTAPALAGDYTFSYVVNDSATPAATSNSATVTVTVTAVVPPTANNDTANATTGATISIPVLANDTAGTSAINPATVVVTPPTGGTAIANANGTVSYTAPAGAGSYSFTYTVNDSALTPLTSNSATVTVTVTAPVVIPPTANNDTAAAAAGATVPISVLTNDTAGTNAINPATVVVTAPTGGTAVANANGTVSYTAPAAAGSYTFTYTVKDNGVAPATSNSATVTVTVFVPPVAVNDSATTASGTAAVISVLANDTAGSSAINAASVVIATPPASGTAVANANGTVTFTPAAGFVGTRTFTYNVKDINGRVSNNATVTVTVTAPPETLTVTIAQFTANGSEWKIEGSTTARIARETIRIYNGPTIAAPLLGTVTVDPNGLWKFSLKPGPAPSNPARISLQSSLTPPGIRENVTVTVK